MPRWQSQSDGFVDSSLSKSQKSLSDGWKSGSSSGWKSFGSQSTPSLTNLGHISSSPAYSFSSGKKRSQSTSRSAEIPGPGAYVLGSSLSGNAPSFGSSARGSFGVPSGPGPAAYDLQGEVSKKGMRMGPKLEPKEKVVTGPGPNAYGDVCQKSKPARSKALKKNGFGSAVRKSFGDEATAQSASPGPGGYFPPVEWPRGKPSENCSFGAAERQSMSKKQSVPGPGTYNIKTTLQGPKWSTTTRGFENQNNCTIGEQLETAGLGPASYLLPSTLQQRRFTIRGKPSGSLEKEKEGPAPGAYNLAQHMGEGGSKPKTRATKFGSSTRDPAEDVEQFEYPGPGWYRPKYVGDHRIPEASIGTGPRSVGLSKDTGVPAPTAYDTSTGLEGPNFSISAKLDDAAIRCWGRDATFDSKDEVPGPGAYDPCFGETEAHQQSMGNLARSLNVDSGEGPARPWYLEASYRHPGPSSYRPERYDKRNIGSEGPIGPKFGASMKARVRQARSVDETPGPGAHGPAATCIGR